MPGKKKKSISTPPSHSSTSTPNSKSTIISTQIDVSPTTKYNQKFKLLFVSSSREKSCDVNQVFLCHKDLKSIGVKYGSIVLLNVNHGNYINKSLTHLICYNSSPACLFCDEVHFPIPIILT
jgi:hypothetical protein